MRMVALGLAAVLLGCGGRDLPGDEADRGRPKEAMALTQIPAGVSCIEFEADGLARSVSRSVDVVPGASNSLDLRDLPTGTVLLSAHAWKAPCNAIAGTPWTWFSQQETVQVAAQTAVALTFYH